MPQQYNSLESASGKTSCQDFVCPKTGKKNGGYQTQNRLSSRCPYSWTCNEANVWMSYCKRGFQIFPTKPINSLATEEQNDGQSFSSNALHRKFPSSTFLLDRRNLAKELGDIKMRHVPRVLQMIFSGREIW